MNTTHLNSHGSRSISEDNGPVYFGHLQYDVYELKHPYSQKVAGFWWLWLFFIILFSSGYAAAQGRCTVWFLLTHSHPAQEKPDMYLCFFIELYQTNKINSSKEPLKNIKRQHLDIKYLYIVCPVKDQGPYYITSGQMSIRKSNQKLYLKKTKRCMNPPFGYLVKKYNLIITMRHQYPPIRMDEDEECGEAMIAQVLFVGL